MTSISHFACPIAMGMIIVDGLVRPCQTLEVGPELEPSIGELPKLFAFVLAFFVVIGSDVSDTKQQREPNRLTREWPPLLASTPASHHRFGAGSAIPGLKPGDAVGRRPTRVDVPESPAVSDSVAGSCRWRFWLLGCSGGGW